MFSNVWRNCSAGSSENEPSGRDPVCPVVALTPTRTAAGVPGRVAAACQSGVMIASRIEHLCRGDRIEGHTHREYDQHETITTTVRPARSNASTTGQSGRSIATSQTPERRSRVTSRRSSGAVCSTVNRSTCTHRHYYGDRMISAGPINPRTDSINTMLLFDTHRVLRAVRAAGWAPDGSGHGSRSLTDRRSGGAQPCRQSACPGGAGPRRTHAGPATVTRTRR